MTVELYQQHMINRNGWATATEIQASSKFIWFKYKYLATTVNRKSIHEINNANQNVMSTDDFLCSQHNKHSNNNCNHEDPSQSSNIYSQAFPCGHLN
jgi:hypothetical protein